ncbi:hypothetical protein BRADI_3g30715v3 [Brachypodium distachyon]|uniref:Uncharacterized protein n=1 Tax=Brachypodium distachyon TaxID=15368 RepID=A0A2K2D097_BRADI|nr:hypothetical protein BRADI_3g30715v3 [Brachypodium distachyon]
MLLLATSISSSAQRGFFVLLAGQHVVATTAAAGIPFPAAHGQTSTSPPSPWSSAPPLTLLGDRAPLQTPPRPEPARNRRGSPLPP